MEDLIDEIIDWYENENIYDFDPTFVLEMKERLEDGQELTERQCMAIENIYEKWVNP